MFWWRRALCSRAFLALRLTYHDPVSQHFRVQTQHSTFWESPSLYLGYKLTIEWYESDKNSRERVASRIDFWVRSFDQIDAFMRLIRAI